DRVRADASLPVVDDGAFVVGPQQDHRPVEIQERLFAQPLDLAIADALRVADHAPQVALGGKNLRHSGRSLPAGWARDVATACKVGDPISKRNTPNTQGV